MTLTRASAQFPRLDIEIAHRAAPGEGAEYLSIQLRATPGFEAVAAFLDPFALPRFWLQLNPFTAWLAAALPPPPAFPDAGQPHARLEDGTEPS